MCPKKLQHQMDCCTHHSWSSLCWMSAPRCLRMCFWCWRVNLWCTTWWMFQMEISQLLQVYSRGLKMAASLEVCRCVREDDMRSNYAVAVHRRLFIVLLIFLLTCWILVGEQIKLKVDWAQMREEEFVAACQRAERIDLPLNAFPCRRAP